MDYVRDLWTRFSTWMWPPADPRSPLLDPRQPIAERPRTLKELNRIIHYPPIKIRRIKLP